MKFSTLGIKIAAAAFVLTSVAASPVFAQQYDFLSPPNPDTNRMYRVNIKTGEMGACWYGRDKGIGFTDCRPVGEGAGPQKSGRYKLFATKFDSEKGVFRVNTLTGEMSLCWVRRGSLVCTVPNR